MNTTLEVFLISCGKAQLVVYHRLEIPCEWDGANPDEQVTLKINKLGIDTTDNSAISHSTSWRFQDGRILLTYIVPLALHALADIPVSIVNLEKVICPESASAMSPHPTFIAYEHVLLHGLRHLNFLVYHHNNSMLASAMLRNGTLDLLRQLKPTVAGQLPPLETVSGKNSHSL